MIRIGRLVAVLCGGLVGTALVGLGVWSNSALADDRRPSRGDHRALDHGDVQDNDFFGDASVEDAEFAEPRRRGKRRRYRRRKRDFNAGIYIGPDRFGIFLSDRDFRRFRGKRRRDYYYRGRRNNHRYNRRFSRAGHWYVEPRYNRYFGRRCHPVYKRGFYDGYRVLIRARRCYNRFGDGFIVRGSRRIVEYY